MDWTSRVREAFAASRVVPEEDVIEELSQHARAMYEAARADGCSHDEAERRVRDQLDLWRTAPDALRHRSHRRAPVAPPPAASSSWIAGVAQDVRYAVRLLRRQPRHAVLTMATMAVGIGATTVLFSLTYGVLLKPLPWPRADRIVVLKETRGGRAPRFGEFTNAAYLAWREQPTTVDGIAAWSQRLVTLSGAGEPERIRVTAATASLFPVLGVRPLIGSVFGERDETSPVVVLSEGLWRQRFGADPAVVGTLINLDGQSYTVRGVLPDPLVFPDRKARAVVPYSVGPTAGNQLSMFSAIALLRPGATALQAAAEGTARGRVAADTGLTTSAVFGSTGPVAITAQPLRAALTTDVRRPLLVLLAAVALLLGAATANVAGLQLARTTTRSREIAIRAALGAGGARLARQLLVESVLIGIAGGAAGLGLTRLLHGILPAMLPADFPRADDLGLDAAVLAFAVVVSAFAGLAFGVLPALRGRRVNLVQALVAGGPAPAGGGVPAPASRARLIIMSAQVAIACVLLIGASLLGRSFVALLHADRGYDLTGVLSARLSMPAGMYPAPERRFAMVEQILARLAATPGVTDAAFTSELPLTPGGSTSAFALRSPNAAGELITVQASPRIVSPRYFPALGMRIVSGRGFTDADTDAAEPVVVVNETFARRYLGGAPLGAKLPVAGYAFRGDEQVESTVIGVADDVRYVAGATTSQPEIYYCHRQMRGRLPVQTVTIAARSSGDFSAAAAALRTAVGDADERLVADLIMPMQDRLLTTLARPRLYAALLGAFAAFALIIAAVGLVGLLSYSVSQRSREIAIRTAIGARPADILYLVLRQGLTVTAAGLATGLLAAAWLSRLLAAHLYGVSAHDPATFVAVPLLLIVVGAAACFLPARRAARMDPLRALRAGE